MFHIQASGKFDENRSRYVSLVVVTYNGFYSPINGSPIQEHSFQILIRIDVNFNDISLNRMTSKKV